MVKLIARIEAKAGSETLVAEALAELSGPSNEEPGCIEYVVCRGAEDATKLYVLEDWKTQEDLDAHMELPHFKAFLAKVGEALAGPPEIEFIEKV